MIWRRTEFGRGIELPVGEGPRPKRQRVVLADGRQPVTVLQRVAEVEEQTSVGEQVVREFMRKQFLSACVKFGAVVVLLGALPLAAYLFPAFAHLSVWGIRLSWVLIGVLPFPLLFAVGCCYHRAAERRERDFVRDLER